jgi:hypothetical protein
VVTPTNGATLPAGVTLVVGGLPPGAVATITPQIVTAGAGATNVTLSVQVPSQSASLHLAGVLALALSPLMLGVLLMPLKARMERFTCKRGPTIALPILLALVGTSLIGLSGCGGKNSEPAAQQKAYSLTVTATSGALTHSTLLKLTVQ